MLLLAVSSIGLPPCAISASRIKQTIGSPTLKRGSPNSPLATPVFKAGSGVAVQRDETSTRRRL